MKIIWYPLGLALLAATGWSAEPVKFATGSRQVSLLELYTSEGCSSCPPAEAWLSQLKDSPGLWTNFVPVAFHVDYWNYLGWRDPWSDEKYSDRQRTYANLWHSENIYTPEFVLNGREWHRGFLQNGVPAPSEGKAAVLTAGSEDIRHWQITFVPDHAQGLTYEAHAALLVSGVLSNVRAGENAGRQLKHDFAVVAFTEVPLASRSNEFKASLVLDGGFDKPPGRLAVAIWVSSNGQPEPIQAVGGWLTDSRIPN